LPRAKKLNVAIGIYPSVPVLVVGSLVFGFAIGHVTTLSPVVVRREFGAEAFGSVYGGAATVIQFTSHSVRRCSGTSVSYSELTNLYF
jgi:hypothetical protein